MQQQKTVTAMAHGGLYFVATPIGNLADITYRAVEILNEVDYILAEDTRNTKKLLNHYHIATPLVSCHEHNQFERLPEIINDIKSGKIIAMVSDAGMPAISDPGTVIAKGLLEAKLPFTVLPGSSAGISSYVVSGMSESGRFTFHGFLPTKQQARIEELTQYKESQHPVLFYESPNRITKLLEAMQEVFPGKSRWMIARELTKLHETLTWGELDDIDLQTVDELDTWKGEIVVVLEPFQEEVVWTEQHIATKITNLLPTVRKPKDAIKEVAKLSGLKTSDVYQIWEDHKEAEDGTYDGSNV